MTDPLDKSIQDLCETYGLDEDAMREALDDDSRFIRNMINLPGSKPIIEENKDN